MAINFSDLSVMLDEHFRLTPPLDSQYTTASGAVREFGDGVSLGDGTSMAGVRGLENIQVVEKVTHFDDVRQISMRDWLQKTIKENPKPEAVASAVQNLLKNGQISYFEQGREFATRLSLNPKTKQLNGTPIKREALPPVKPTLNFGQKFLRLIRLLPDAELNAYNRELLSYEVKMKALATSTARVPIGVGIVLAKDDGKGRIVVNGVDMAKAVKYAVNHHERSQLSPMARREYEGYILAGESLKETADLKMGPNLNEKKALAALYPNGQPEGITNFNDHVKSRTEMQESIGSKASLLSENGFTTFDRIIFQAMNPENKEAKSDEIMKLANSRAYKDLINSPAFSSKYVSANKLFDKFAQSLQRYPIEGIKPKQIENLLNVCLEPHKGLSLAVQASKNPEMLQAANNKQIEKQNNKQMGKEAPKMKASPPKMG